MKWGAIILCAILLMLFFEPVRAQESTPTPTPTVTPTPAYESEFTTSDGTRVVIERRITLGEIAITVSLLLAIAIIVLYFLFKVVSEWLP